MADCSYCQQTLPEGARRCPRCGTPAGTAGEEKAQPDERHATLIEPIRSSRESLLSSGKQWREKQIAPPAALTVMDDARESSGTNGEPDQNAVVFRPVFRAPLALLTILDDGQRERGEEVRIRADRTVIGRTNGDILIPHDPGISATHAEIVREFREGQYRWYLQDLESRNGTFVRITRARLVPRQQILIGTRRFRFDGGSRAPEAPSREDAARATLPWQGVSPADLANQIPALVELTPTGEGSRYLLRQKENIIGGRARDCHLVLADDPFVSPVHCCVRQDEQGRWMIENHNSLNGVWLRIGSITIDREGEFQLGEQRFTLRILS